MRDGAWRRAVKALALASFVADRTLLGLWRRARGERPYRLVGSCERSGLCCERPAVRANLWVWHLPALRRLFLWWQRAVNGFELISTDGDARMFVFRCGHFDVLSRACDTYASRPGMCRDYPRVLLAQPNPELLPGCGYRVLAPNAEGLRRALEGRGLTDEQLARLKRDLHLGP